jgi:hypothetical protein
MDVGISSRSLSLWFAVFRDIGHNTSRSRRSVPARDSPHSQDQQSVLSFSATAGEAPMKRLGYLAMLMVLSSSATTAQAGQSYSFVIGGHRIHIEARHGCRSLSCVSWSDLGRNRRDRDEDAPAAKPSVAAPAPAQAQPAPAAVQAPPAPAPVQQQVQPAQQAQPVQQAQVAPPAPQVQSPQVQVASPAPVVTAPSRTIELASTTTQSVPPPASKIGSKTESKSEARIVVLPAPATSQPPAPQPAVTQPTVTQPAPQPAPALTKTKDERTTADTPLGDWQTEGKKGLVRIEPCGKSLCGYVLNASTNAAGETVLSNMTSKSANKWTGDIFSRATGNSYYARMTLKAPNTLHVEACAVLRFFCSGNDWTRVVTKPDELIISRQGRNAPSS